MLLISCRLLLSRWVFWCMFLNWVMVLVIWLRFFVMVLSMCVVSSMMLLLLILLVVLVLMLS